MVVREWVNLSRRNRSLNQRATRRGVRLLFFTGRYGPKAAREAQRERAEAALSWTKLMGNPGSERSAALPALPGEAVGPLAPVAVPHAKDGVALVSARVLPW